MAKTSDSSIGWGRNGGGGGDAASFAAGYAVSDAFKAVFREGMLLVEETAAYLDGAGREQSRALGRMASLAYASESMRLTTRLMQVASWLLLQRAVTEGELTREQARREKHKVNLVVESQPAPAHAVDELPQALRDLIGRSLRLQARIIHLDGLLSGAPPQGLAEAASPVARQQDMLRMAFARRR